MAGYIGNRAVGLNVTTGNILGDVGVGGDVTIQDDLFLDSDSAIIHFGEDGEVKLIHAADGGLQLTGSGLNSNFTLAAYHTTDGTVPDLNLHKSGSSTIGTNAATANAEALGQIRFSGVDTSGDSRDAAKISVTQDSTASSAVKGNLTLDVTGDIELNADGGQVYIKDGGTNIATFENSANALTLTDGNLKINTAGHGIDFSAFGAGDDIDNNLLNDYEEGSFDAVYAASGTAFGAIAHNTQTGNYTKVGNLVTISIALRTGSYTAGSTDGIVTITGLPFTAGGTNTYPLAINAQDAWTNFMPYQGWVANTTVTLTNNSGGSDRTGYRTVPVANMTAGANKNRIYLMGTYTTTA